MILNKEYIHFNTDIERDEFLKKYKLLSQNPRKDKVFYYKGRDVDSAVPCKVLGYEEEFNSSATLVIDYGKGTCFILSDFFKQMQSSTFSLDSYAESE